LVILFAVISLHAQDYIISFSGNGASTSVENVKVENLTQGKSISLSGAETLHLVSKVTAISPLLDYIDYPLNIYPNLYSDYCTVEVPRFFYARNN
jgi:hypothetical protein